MKCILFILALVLSTAALHAEELKAKDLPPKVLDLLAARESGDDEWGEFVLEYLAEYPAYRYSIGTQTVYLCPWSSGARNTLYKGFWTDQAGQVHRLRFPAKDELGAVRDRTMTLIGESAPTFDASANQLTLIAGGGGYIWTTYTVDASDAGVTLRLAHTTVIQNPVDEPR